MTLREFAFELSELKRQFGHADGLSVAGALFRQSWSMLAYGCTARETCVHISAYAIAGVGLGSLRLPTLASLLADRDEWCRITLRAFEANCPEVNSGFRDEMVRALHLQFAIGDTPPFVDLLLRQPRAGATAPGKPRLTLLPQENHGEHCLAVAVLGALLTREPGADPARAFLAGLAHHLHNARMPDAGFAGETLLGNSLEPLMRRLTEAELATLAPPLRMPVNDALTLVGDTSSVEGRAFNAGDVIDRVVQQHCHERAAQFSIRHALEDLEIVHEGPLQRFGQGVLREYGLL